jgi:hypothetical protein
MDRVPNSDGGIDRFAEKFREILPASEKTIVKLSLTSGLSKVRVPNPKFDRDVAFLSKIVILSKKILGTVGSIREDATTFSRILTHIQLYKSERGTATGLKGLLGKTARKVNKHRPGRLPDFVKKTDLLEKMETHVQGKINEIRTLQKLELSNAILEKAYGDTTSEHAKAFESSDSMSLVSIGREYVSKEERTELVQTAAASAAPAPFVSASDRQHTKRQLAPYTLENGLILPKSGVYTKEDGKEIFLEAKLNIPKSTSESLNNYLSQPAKFDSAITGLVRLAKDFKLGDITTASQATPTNYLEAATSKLPRYDNLPPLANGSLGLIDTDQFRRLDEGEKNSLPDIIRLFPLHFKKILREARHLGIDIDKKQVLDARQEAMQYLDAFKSVALAREDAPAAKIYDLPKDASTIEQTIYQELTKRYDDSMLSKARSIDTFTSFELKGEISVFSTTLESMKAKGNISNFIAKVDEFDESQCSITIII